MIRYGIWAKRNVTSVFGGAEAWLKNDGIPQTFDTYAEASEKAHELMQNISTANVSYFPKEMEQEVSDEHSSDMGMKMS